MAKPTQQQVSALEAAMLQQFKLLAEASAFRIGLARKFGLDGEPFLKYNKIYVDLVNSWINREVKYERELIKDHIYGIIASGDLKKEDFFTSAALPKLQFLVNKWNKEKPVTGVGWIPLLIWAVIAIAGFFTAQQVVDDLTTTTQEKQELLEATSKTAKELGLTNEQATSLINETQQQASEGTGLGSTVKWLAAAAAVAFIAPPLLNSLNK